MKREEDMSGDGISFKVAERAENDLLNVEGEDLEISRSLSMFQIV